MRLRTQISLYLIASFLLGVLTISGGLLALELQGLKSDSAKEAQGLLAGGLRAAEQALLADDFLMLPSFLESLQESRPEILRMRVRQGNGRWNEMGDALRGPLGRSALILRGAVEAPGGGQLELEFAFSQDALEREGRGRIARAARRTAFLAGLAGLASLAVGFSLGRRLSQPVLALIGAYRDLAEGRRTPEVPLRSGWAQELRSLVARFNEMASRLRELDLMKRDFVNSATHELRSPLGAIESSAKLLLRSGNALPEAERKEMLRHIQKNARNLGSLVTNLLEISRIERGAMEFSPRVLDLAELVRDTVNFMAAEALDKEIVLGFEFSAGPARVNADPERLRQVLVNLIANALKFSPAGSKVTVYAQPGGGQVECGVRDQGPGVPPEDRARIFRPFERGSGTGKIEGTGIGLALCKTLVEMQGGRIDLESEPGKGSRFYFSLPEAPPEREEALLKSRESLLHSEE